MSKRVNWTIKKREQLLDLADQGMSYSDIASLFGVSVSAIRSNVTRFRDEGVAGPRSRLSKQQRNPPMAMPDPVPERVAPGDHLENYHRARRGFHVPAHKQDQYFALLKSGVPIAVAAAELGLSAGEGA